MAETVDVPERSAIVAREVIPFMARHNIPVTPENYKVWFEYHFGGNEELERDIGEKKARGIPLDKELTEHLYDEYFGDKKKKEVLSLIQEEAKKMLSAVIENVLANIKNQTEFHNKLKKHSAVLHNAREVDQLTEVIERIIEDANTLEKSNLGLQKKLESTTVEAENLRKLIEKKEIELLIDPLTGLYNRRGLDKHLQELYDAYQKSGAVFSAIMLDIDFFTQFNNSYGHAIGDQALQVVSATLKEVTKGMDYAARYGGEEFTILLPMTPLPKGILVAEHVRKAVFEKKLKLRRTGESLGSLSISLGVAQISNKDTAESVVERADAALSLAKKTGRNNVKSEKDLSTQASRKPAAV